MQAIFVVDTGEDIVGIYSVADGTYRAHCGASKRAAAVGLQDADILITYGGNGRDLKDLARFSGLPETEPFPLHGKHIDMLDICWGNILGTSLASTYARQFAHCPHFPDTYEGSNERDVYMTFKLWERWQRGELTDGHGRLIPGDATWPSHRDALPE